ncbi:hypothetical protein [Salinibius halmophilus]|uniref:hypothetical protein n=1 Tax=Salinibius halmophilus TaxID=1853216 RepID=UPI000E668076|nr:hypothetical protein [Salinibius halmophilus]
MNSTMRHKGITVLPVIFAVLVGVALLLLLQQQQQGLALQQGNLVQVKRAQLLANAAGEWTAMSILATDANNPTCPSNLAFTDSSQPSMQVTIRCSRRSFNSSGTQLFDINIVVESGSNADYIRQQFEWVLSL